MLVDKRFRLDEAAARRIAERRPHRFGFGGFGEVVYYRTYSRFLQGHQENWFDTCLRVVNGVMSLRKDWCHKMWLRWRDADWMPFALGLFEAMYTMRFLPPGRGLWAMGTPYIYERGSMALNNCAGTLVGHDTWIEDLCWGMDALMLGCGVGFRLSAEEAALRARFNGVRALERTREVYTVPDSREGWVDSVRRLLGQAERGRRIGFDYSRLRPAGAPLKGFGGSASGPEPLRELHELLYGFVEDFLAERSGRTRFLADCANAIGYCVMAGNIRRSAEVLLGSPFDEAFLSLKDYRAHPGRERIGGLSNNSVVMASHEDFLQIPRIAEGIRHNGEPGIVNMVNIGRYGRYGQELPDAASTVNPCSEIPLEDKELCNLVEVFPTRCGSREAFHEVLRYATFYAQTVTLLPTHSPDTNAVIARNRRMGVSLSGVADWLEADGAARLTRILRDSYQLVRRWARDYARAAGVPEPLRVTTIKPSGTVSQLAGVSSGMHFPPFRYALRRIRVGRGSPIERVLLGSGMPHEPDVTNPEHTTIFEWPVDQGKTRPMSRVSAWEQFTLLAMLQREWSDNMVSCTISLHPDSEGPQVESMLGQFIPLIKSVSVLPRVPAGAYPQMPYEEIDAAGYERRMARLRPIDWSALHGSEGDEPLYCNADYCELG